MKLIVIVGTILLVLSCTKGKQMPRPSIHAKYYKGNVETFTNIKCDSIVNKPSSWCFKDTLLQDVNICNEIISELLKTKYSEINSVCDARIHCCIVLENGVSISICICDNDCIQKDGVSLVQSKKLVYLIRSKIGYYNYYREDDLNYFDEIKQYGIPLDYKCLIRTVKNDGQIIPFYKTYLD